LTCDRIVTYGEVVEEDEAAVFRALADVSRRRLLDALFAEDGQSLEQLCEHFPDVTRFAVMKHLGVLEDANLVTTRREGRRKRHFLNPIPIQFVADRWISKYARPLTRAMAGLQDDIDTARGAS
jgi:DNA-binding transcriptional ArsR family regulator